MPLPRVPSEDTNTVHRYRAASSNFGSAASGSIPPTIVIAPVVDSASIAAIGDTGSEVAGPTGHRIIFVSIAENVALAQHAEEKSALQSVSKLLMNTKEAMQEIGHTPSLRELCDIEKEMGPCRTMLLNTAQKNWFEKDVALDAARSVKACWHSLLCQAQL